jgi:glycosyltransferase
MKISIITAVYNNRENIQYAIDSVQSQNYQNIEHIIVDGNSNDGTIDIIKKNENKLAKWISEKDNGIYDALNKGLYLATGDVVGFLHSDDVYASNNVIQKIVDEFTKTKTESIYGDLQYVSKTDLENIIRYWKSKKYTGKLLKQGWMPPHPTFFVKKEIYNRHGNFDTSFKIAADYDLMLRFLGVHKISTSYIPMIITKMRVGGASNKSIRNIYRKSYEDYKALKNNSIGGFYTLFLKNVTKISQFIIK